MRQSVIRLIARREIRDLLRDRRTVLLILLLPILLYPLFGLAGFVFAQSLTERNSRIGIVGLENLPTGELALIENGAFVVETPKDLKEEGGGGGKLDAVPLTGDPEAALAEKSIEAALVVPKDFAKDLSEDKVPTLTLLDRDGDEKSKLAVRRLQSVLKVWTTKLREDKFRKKGFPKDFDRVLELKDSQSQKTAGKKAADELRDTFVKAFPFILMMWLVAGAIQPAVDLTAGEKERGTMETLLISPASRTEIVFGKFLAVFAFTFTSVIWNVIWLTGGAILLEHLLGYPILNPVGLIGCLVLGVPLAMFFSAISLSLGVFARSSKEGQYYLMPLILVTMPLAMWSMMPGMDLTVGRAIIPVTGAMLLQQKFLGVGHEPIPWLMLVPVLGGLCLGIVIALWLAVKQFQRESVLFREIGAAKKGWFSKS